MGFPNITKCTIKVRLTKLSDNPNHIRDDVIDGVTEHMPKVGDFFEMLAPARDIPDKLLGQDGNLYCGFRYIHTSEIKKLLEADDKSITFRTLNSTYQVEVLTDSETK